MFYNSIIFMPIFFSVDGTELTLGIQDQQMVVYWTRLSTELESDSSIFQENLHKCSLKICQLCMVKTVHHIPLSTMEITIQMWSHKPIRGPKNKVVNEKSQNLIWKTEDGQEIVNFLAKEKNIIMRSVYRILKSGCKESFYLLTKFHYNMQNMH